MLAVAARVVCGFSNSLLDQGHVGVVTCQHRRGGGGEDVVRVVQVHSFSACVTLVKRLLNLVLFQARRSGSIGGYAHSSVRPSDSV